jgi:hypothetical protein
MAITKKYKLKSLKKKSKKSKLNKKGQLSIKKNKLFLMKGGNFSEKNFKENSFYIPSRTYPLRMDKMDEYKRILTKEGADEEVIKIFEGIIKVTRHVSFDQLIASIKKVIEQFERDIKDEEFDLYIPIIDDKPVEQKSNFWISKIFYLLMNKKPNKIFTNPAEYESNISNIVMCDDAIYSGTQMARTLGYTADKLKDKKINLLCPFISNMGINVIKSVSDMNVQIYYNELDKLLSLEYYFENDDNLKQFAYPFSIQNMFVFDMRKPPHPFYFDHRVADNMSSLPFLYELGQVNFRDQNGKFKRVILNSLLENCKLSDNEIKEIKNHKGGLVKFLEKCPVIPYRSNIDKSAVIDITPSEFISKYK